MFSVITGDLKKNGQGGNVPRVAQVRLARKERGFWSIEHLNGSHTGSGINTKEQSLYWSCSTTNRNDYTRVYSTYFAQSILPFPSIDDQQAV